MRLVNGELLKYDPASHTWNVPVEEIPRAPVMTTASGVVIDYLNPTEFEVRESDIAYAAGNICRYNGARKVLLLEHFALCTTLATRIEGASPRLLGLVAMHDFAETVLGDIVTGLKRLLPEYRVLESRWERHFWNHFGYDHPTEDEAAFVRRVDLRALVVETHCTAHPVHGITAHWHGGLPSQTEADTFGCLRYCGPVRQWEITINAVHAGAK